MFLNSTFNSVLNLSVIPSAAAGSIEYRKNARPTYHKRSCLGACSS